MKEDKQEEVHIKVASYNILADCQMKDSLNIKDPFYKSNPNRIKDIIKDIISINADIFCLQEVERKEELFDFFIKNGYDYKLQTRPNNLEGCCIFWKNTILHLVQYNTLEFKSNLINTELYNKDNIAQFVILKDKKNKIYYIVANTHLLFNLKRGDIKIAQIYQVSLVIDKLAKLLQNSNKLKIFSFICGDFNSVRNSGVYKLLTEGMLDLTNISKFDISGQSHMIIPRNINFKTIDIKAFSEKYNKAFKELDYFNGDVDNSYFYYEIINTKPSVKEEMIKLKFKDKFPLNKQKQLLVLSFPYKSAYYKCNTKEPDFSYYSKSKIGTVDFIFYKSYTSDEVAKMKPIFAFEYNTFNDILSRLISNNIYPSDHIPIYVDFTINN